MKALATKEDRLQLVPEAIQQFAPIDENQAGAFLGVTGKTLQTWRRKGIGPNFISISYRTVRYLPKDLLEWMEGKKLSNTAEKDLSSKTIAAGKALGEAGATAAYKRFGIEKKVAARKK